MSINCNSETDLTSIHKDKIIKSIHEQHLQAIKQINAEYETKITSINLEHKRLLAEEETKYLKLLLSRMNQSASSSNSRINSKSNRNDNNVMDINNDRADTQEEAKPIYSDKIMAIGWAGPCIDPVQVLKENMEKENINNITDDTLNQNYWHK